MDERTYLKEEKETMVYIVIVDLGYPFLSNADYIHLGVVVQNFRPITWTIIICNGRRRVSLFQTIIPVAVNQLNQLDRRSSFNPDHCSKRDTIGSFTSLVNDSFQIINYAGDFNARSLFLCRQKLGKSVITTTTTIIIRFIII